ncbi:hypothetical protein DFH11DRAFT_1506864 [Phellopilus nigrolimitatus]|nr:hypothetical protein DFH11DRAFT_1506864 [Phellopilus nigrolimitatus]
MKLILTGATGAAGLEILRTAIADPAVSQITVLSRRALPSSIPPSNKVVHIPHTDFASYPPELLARLAGHGACIWALGVSQRGMDEEAYTYITHDYPLAALQALDEAGVRGADGQLRFVYFSGAGADAEGKSRFLFGRVKGLAEKDLSAYVSSSTSPSPSSQTSLHVFNLRPGYFFPSNLEDAAALRSRGARALHIIMRPFLRAVMPSIATDIGDLARFAMEAAKGQAGAGATFTNKQMKELLEKWKNSESQS